MPEHRRRTFALIAVLAVALSGCAPSDDTGWHPPAQPAPLASPDGAPSAVAFADTAMVGQRLRVEGRSLDARVAYLPGENAFNDRIDALLRDIVAPRGTRYSPAALAPGSGMRDRDCIPGSTSRDAKTLLTSADTAPPGGSGTSVSCEVLFAAGGFVMERLRSVRGDATHVAEDRTDTLLAQDGRLVDPAALWAPDAPTRLWRRLMEDRRREAGGLSTLPLADPPPAQRDLMAKALAQTVPGASGLRLPLPAGLRAPELDGLGVPPTSETAWTLVDPDPSLLSDVGRALAAARGNAPAWRDALPSTFHVDCGLFPCWALSYDDGPGPLTPTLLRTLAERRIPATFYMTGWAADHYPDLVRQVNAAGHEIGNHTWNHPHLPDIPIAQARSELRDTTAILEKLTGKPITSFRPPYGHYNARILDAAGVPAVLWTVDPLDWQNPPSRVLLDRVIPVAKAGGILLSHDIQPTTIDNAPAMIDGLADRGFVFVTVTKLFGGKIPAGASKGL